MVTEAHRSLTSSQNPDGGWGSEAQRPSTTEATALAVWALGSGDYPGSAPAVRHGLDWLRSRQKADGSWPVSDQVPLTSWMTSLGVLTLARFPAERSRALLGARWLLAEEGQMLPLLGRLYYRLFPQRRELDHQLKGWPWLSHTSSWVEPTAYALLALKGLRPLLPGEFAGRRIEQGEAMLLDRMCVGGGWNYGNSQVLGSALPPYPDTTALALIALQDRPHEGVRQSLQALRTLLSGSRSGLVLSLSTLCLRLYGECVSELRSRLAEAYLRTGFRGENRVIALALLAMDESAVHFRVPTHGP